MAHKVEVSIRKKHGELLDQYNPVEIEVKELLGTACDENGWIFQDRLKSIYALFACEFLGWFFNITSGLLEAILRRPCLIRF